MIRLLHKIPEIEFSRSPPTSNPDHTVSQHFFKKVIGQDNSEPARQAPEPRHPEPQAAPAAAAPSFRPSNITPSATRNVLSSDVEIKGTVKFTNDLVVDGKIEGEINSNGSLTVGENARIKAEIKTAAIVVYGKVHGNLTATDRVELKASAEVVGDIKAKTLAIEAGAIFIGKSTVGSPEQVPAQSAAAAPQAAAKPAAPADAPKQVPLAGIHP